MKQNIVKALIGIGSVIALTEYGVSKGVPSAFSFLLVLAALFGVLFVRVGR